MSSIDKFTELFEQMRLSLQAGRLSHAYVIVGSPRGRGLEFAESVLKLLFCRGLVKPCGTCPNCERVEHRTHPDIQWVEPESKAREIKVKEQMRPLIQTFSRTAYEGGWRAAVVLYADRMNDNSANAFLKTLEEPGPQSIMLLVTDHPQAMLATILSRCQRLDLTEGQVLPDGPWREPLFAILREADLSSTMPRMAVAAQIRRILEEESKKTLQEEKQKAGDDDSKEVIESRAKARYLKTRSEILECLALWTRDRLVSLWGANPEVLHFPEEMARVRAGSPAATEASLTATQRSLQTLIRRLEGNVTEAAALESFVLEAAL